MVFANRLDGISGLIDDPLADFEGVFVSAYL
jgi:hypothetical protein